MGFADLKGDNRYREQNGEPLTAYTTDLYDTS